MYRFVSNQGQLDDYTAKIIRERQENIIISSILQKIKY